MAAALPLAELIVMVMEDFEGNKDKVIAEVDAICKKYPLYEGANQ